MDSARLETRDPSADDQGGRGRWGPGPDGCRL